jgi:Domain of unknown function (DUF6134)
MHEEATTMMRRCVAAWIAGSTLCGSAHAAANDWAFRVLLDGRPIGQHRFTVSDQGEERRVTSQANFAVRILGFSAYEYRHTAVEQWRGDCLTELTAATDDDGKGSEVRATLAGDTLHVIADQAVQPLNGCVMTFAYWNPAIRTQTRLLNPQTGRFEPVQITEAGTGLLDVRGVPTLATRVRITGLSAAIDVWYSPQGEWLGLDSLVNGRHKLSYRL